MCNAGAVARMRAADEAREIAEVDALREEFQRMDAACVDDGEEASLALARRLMAEDAAELFRDRATDPRPPASPPPAPRPPPRPAPAVAAPAPAATQAARPEPPDALVCPISMELMRDPVMAMDGHTYERRNIERWLADHQTSPKTNEPLPSLTLVPNHAVKSMVQDYLDG